MTTSSFQQELLQSLESLGEAQQQLVLRFAQSLTAGATNQPGPKGLLRFAGALSGDAADDLERLIEEAVKGSTRMAGRYLLDTSSYPTAERR